MDNEITTTHKEFDEVPSRSMVSDLNAMVSLVPDVLSEKDQARWDRLKSRLASVARGTMGAMYHRSIQAEALYDLQQEEDWMLLIDPETQKPYRTWSSFRAPLSSAIGIGVGTIGYHLRLVRYGREVLRIPPGEFAKGGGLTTVSHVANELSTGCDGRAIEHFSATVRPKTEQFRKRLDKLYPGVEGYDEQIRMFYEEHVAHDYEDPSAINKPPSELANQADEALGRPNFYAVRTTDGYKCFVRYADYDEGGVTVVGEIDDCLIKFGDYVNPLVREWVEKRLGIQ